MSIRCDKLKAVKAIRVKVTSGEKKLLAAGTNCPSASDLYQL